MGKTSQADNCVGIVGVGRMGHGIAASILRAGYPLVFLDHPGNQPVSDLLDNGATEVSSVAQLAQHAATIILCVTGTPQVEEVLYGKEGEGQGGLLSQLRQGMLVIDCSTAIPASTIRIAVDVEAAGGAFMDAAMTRTPREAELGKLNLIIGGDKAVYENSKPLLEAFAENLVYAGAAGSGHRMKLIHNFVSLGFAAILAEAAACAEQAGASTQSLLDVLANGGGGGVVLERMRPFIEARDDSAFRFSLANACKDMSYYTIMAEQAGIPHPTADTIRAAYAHGDKARPNGSVAELMEVWLADAERGS